MTTSDAVRDQLARTLDWHEAHATFDQAVEKVPADKRGAVPPGFDHSVWQLVEHIRLAQDDLLDFAANSNYVHSLAWPDDYWPKQAAPASEQAWTDSIAAYLRGREELKKVARETPDLGAKVPTGKASQTYARAILLVIDHTAYHVGQIIAVRRALGIWPA